MHELQFRKNGINFETLRGLCKRTSSLPSVAYPPSKKCSLNYKAAPQRWWLDRQPWAQEEWSAGRRLVKCIGYDTDEPNRIKDRFGNEDEDSKAVPWYPIFDSGLSRDDCIEVIQSVPLIRKLAKTAGLDPVPRKSACKYCPNNRFDDWHDLHEEDPEAFWDAVDMSREAMSTIESPDVVGLLRGFAPHGKRHLHVWVDGGYGDSIGPPPGSGRRPATDPNPNALACDIDGSDNMPCECRS
jgi:hypothetical protein